MSKTKKSPALLTDLKVNEVSLCRKGMNQGARIALFKRDATSYDEIVANQEAQEKISQQFDAIFKPLYALQESLWSIGNDADAPNKLELARESLQQFLENIEDDVMPNLVNKVLKWQQQGNDMTLEELQAALQKAQDDNKALAEQLETANIEKGMSDREKAYMKDMDDKKRMKFMAMTSDERKAVMDKANFQKSDKDLEKADGENKDELLKALPEAVRKEFSERLQKAENDAKEASELAKAERVARERMVFAKKAQDEIPSLPGETEIKGQVLKYISDAPEEIRDAATAMLKGAEQAFTGLLKEQGANTDGSDAGGTPESELDALVKKHADAHKVSFAKAYTEVLATPEGKKLYVEQRSKK